MPSELCQRSSFPREYPFEGDQSVLVFDIGGIGSSSERLAMKRRLAAILAADVVGYSRLMELDETGTLTVLRAYREDIIYPMIAEYNGRVVKLMGDGALVEFPSVVEAVQCAYEIQKILADRNAKVPSNKRLEFRIGVHIGDIIAEGDDIYGDGVNVAARLESLAEPGGICISDWVYHSISGKLDATFEDLGRQRIKNLASPVHVYAIAIDGQRRVSRILRSACNGHHQWLLIGAAVGIGPLVAAAFGFHALLEEACLHDIVGSIEAFREFCHSR